MAESSLKLQRPGSAAGRPAAGPAPVSIGELPAERYRLADLVVDARAGIVSRAGQALVLSPLTSACCSL